MLGTRPCVQRAARETQPKSPRASFSSNVLIQGIFILLSAELSRLKKPIRHRKGAPLRIESTAPKNSRSRLADFEARSCGLRLQGILATVAHCRALRKRKQLVSLNHRA